MDKTMLKTDNSQEVEKYVACTCCGNKITLGSAMYVRDGYEYCSYDCAGVLETVLEDCYFETYEDLA